MHINLQKRPPSQTTEVAEDIKESSLSFNLQKAEKTIAKMCHN